MNTRTMTHAFAAAGLLLAGFAVMPSASADAGHGNATSEEEPADGHRRESDQSMLEHMQMMHEAMKEHGGHEHGEHLEAMEHMSPAHMREHMKEMMDIGLAMPPMDAEKGRTLFLKKGCIACHAVKGIGGTMGPSFDADKMTEPMNVFEFAARMWRGAPAMVELQEQLFGEPIVLTGQELADIIAFAHDEQVQASLTEEDVPEEFRKLIGN